MITIFNRREICFTFDIKKQSAVREVLAANGIDYVVKATNPQTTNVFGFTGRGRVGSYGVNSDYSYQYKVYVDKKDYEQACYLIRGI